MPVGPITSNPYLPTPTEPTAEPVEGHGQQAAAAAPTTLKPMGVDMDAFCQAQLTVLEGMRKLAGGDLGAPTAIPFAMAERIKQAQYELMKALPPFSLFLDGKVDGGEK